MHLVQITFILLSIICSSFSTKMNDTSEVPGWNGFVDTSMGEITLIIGSIIRVLWVVSCILAVMYILRSLFPFVCIDPLYHFRRNTVTDLPVLSHNLESGCRLNHRTYTEHRNIGFARHLEFIREEDTVSIDLYTNDRESELDSCFDSNSESNDEDVIFMETMTSENNELPNVTLTPPSDGEPEGDEDMDWDYKRASHPIVKFTLPFKNEDDFVIKSPGSETPILKSVNHLETHVIADEVEMIETSVSDDLKENDPLILTNTMNNMSF